MPGYTDKSQQYLRLAVENYKRAGAAESPELKANFSEIAAHYRDTAWLIISLRAASTGK